MTGKIALIPGDGIGPEIVAEAKKVLDTVAKKYGHEFEYETLLMGGCSIDAYGEPLTEESLEKAKASDAVLLGAVGGNVGNSRWYQVAPNLRPEAGLLKIRKGLGLFANIRPAKLFSQLKDACPLKPEIIGDGFDTVNLENEINNFIKNKKVIDIKQSVIYDNEIGQGFITMTVLYENTKKIDNDYKLL